MISFFFYHAHSAGLSGEWTVLRFTFPVSQTHAFLTANANSTHLFSGGLSPEFIPRVVGSLSIFFGEEN